MDISVAICTWNRSDDLAKTLKAFQDLCVPPEVTWELIVVDNNSTDNTAQVLAGYKELLPIRAFHEPKQGHSCARNRAITEARGEFILWTDDDAIPDPGWLTITLESFKNKNADLVYGKAKPIWVSSEPEWFSLELFGGRFALLDHGPDSFVSSTNSPSFYGVNHAARRVVLQSLDGYREDLGLSGTSNGDTVGGDDDTDLFTRAIMAGAKIVYEPDSLVWHRIDPIRCDKKYHRRRNWNARRAYLLSCQTFAPNATRFLGLPRYLYRITLDDLWRYNVNVFKRNHSEIFHYELRLTLFAGVFLESLRKRITSSSRSRKSTSVKVNKP